MNMASGCPWSASVSTSSQLRCPVSGFQPISWQHLPQRAHSAISAPGTGATWGRWRGEAAPSRSRRARWPGDRRWSRNHAPCALPSRKGCMRTGGGSVSLPVAFGADERHEHAAQYVGLPEALRRALDQHELLVVACLLYTSDAADE